MIPAARLAAAIEVLDTIETHHRTAADALADWGKSHRFAGSGDRAALGNLVFDALRHKAMLAHRMGSASPRALILGLAAFIWHTPQEAEQLFSGEGHAPAVLTDEERAALAAPEPDAAHIPAHILGNYPEWLDPSFARLYGEGRAAMGQALSQRAPVDLRVNTLKADRAKVRHELERFGVQLGSIAPTALRIEASSGAQRTPNVEVEAGFQKGWFEIQDEGSQICALLSGVKAGEQVADLCAGGGGKTLALAALMDNKGQIFAWDRDRHRLAPIFTRLERAGVRNAQVKRAGDEQELAQFNGRIDCVVLDVPCTGTGSWRRRPDAKWRLKEKALQDRLTEQAAILARGAQLVAANGRMVYITCSLLAEENEDQIMRFLASRAGGGFVPADMNQIWRTALGTQPPLAPEGVAQLPGLRLSPRTTGTDGFYICVLEKRG